MLFTTPLCPGLQMSRNGHIGRVRSRTPRTGHYPRDRPTLRGTLARDSSFRKSILRRWNAGRLRCP